MKRKLCTLGFLTLALVAMTLGSAWAETIRIGLMCPLTGSWASEGQDMKQIVELLAAETNKAGGINGAQVEIVVEDDGGDHQPAAAGFVTPRVDRHGHTVVDAGGREQHQGEFPAPVAIEDHAGSQQPDFADPRPVDERPVPREDNEEEDGEDGGWEEHINSQGTT